MEIILVIIIGVVISLISAASKKKNQQSEETPARPTMSDIQRAFMMSSQMAPFGRTPETPPETPYGAAPPAARYRPPETRPVPAQRPAAAPRPGQGGTLMESNRFADIAPSAFRPDSAESGDAILVRSRRQQSTLKLFEDKNDFVRAVIYSEILTRKAR